MTLTYFVVIADKNSFSVVNVSNPLKCWVITTAAVVTFNINKLVWSRIWMTAWITTSAREIQEYWLFSWFINSFQFRIKKDHTQMCTINYIDFLIDNQKNQHSKNQTNRWRRWGINDDVNDKKSVCALIQDHDHWR